MEKILTALIVGKEKGLIIIDPDYPNLVVEPNFPTKGMMAGYEAAGNVLSRVLGSNSLVDLADSMLNHVTEPVNPFLIKLIREKVDKLIPKE